MDALLRSTATGPPVGENEPVEGTAVRAESGWATPQVTRTTPMAPTPAVQSRPRSRVVPGEAMGSRHSSAQSPSEAFRPQTPQWPSVPCPLSGPFCLLGPHISPQGAHFSHVSPRCSRHSLAHLDLRAPARVLSFVWDRLLLAVGMA